MGREAEEENQKLWAAAKLRFKFPCKSPSMVSVSLPGPPPPPGETKGPCHAQMPRAIWLWVALMGADSMRSLLDGGRCFSSGAASFQWRFVFGRVTSHPSGRAACCQMVASEVSKAEQTCWRRGARGGSRREETSWGASGERMAPKREQIGPFGEKKWGKKKNLSRGNIQ